MGRWWACGVSLLVAHRAEAHETGSIHGTVADDAGAPLGGAEVVLHGVELSGERHATTADDGRFRFELVPPGIYELDVRVGDAPVVHSEVRVALLTSTEVELSVTEDQTFTPSMDPTTSFLGRAFREEQLDVLPYRTYQGVIQTVPGVYGRVDTVWGGPGTGNPSVRGEGAQGNTYVVDGFSSRNPATKGFGRPLNFDAIESIHVYTDGAPAEFGHFTGMAVDIETKDGGDEHHGSVAVFYQQHAWFEDTVSLYDGGAVDGSGASDPRNVPTTQDRFRSPNVAATAGGPLVEERLWYFASLDLDHTWTERGVPVGDDPADPRTSIGGSFLGKLTWFPTSALTLRYTFDGGSRTSQDIDTSALVAPEATSDLQVWSHAHVLTATLMPDPADVVALQVGYTTSNVDLLPASRDEDTPSRIDATGVLRDNALAFDRVDLNRMGASLVYTRLQDRALGDHVIRAGLEADLAQVQEEIVHTGRTTIPWIDTSGNPDGSDVDVGTRYLGGPSFPCDVPSTCQTVEHWTNVGELGNTVRTLGAFVQDRWEPWRWMSVEAGVRFDLEQGYDTEGNAPVTWTLDGGPGEDYRAPVLVQPRLGVAIDPFDDGRTKLGAHVGRYGDVATNGLWAQANTQTGDGFVRFANDGSGNFVWSNTQNPVRAPLPFDPDFAPAHVDKLHVVVERELVRDLVAGARGVLSWTSDLAEDVNVDLSNFVIVNPTIDTRRYRALELTLSKRFDERWHLFGSYTLSQSLGHNPGQPEGAPGGEAPRSSEVGPYLDDVGELSAREALATSGVLEGFAGLGRTSVSDPDEHDDAGWYGELPYSSVHAIKVDGSYTATFGTRFGVVYEFDSGHAWQKRSFVPYYGYFGFGDGRGSSHMPAVHHLDVRVAQHVAFGEDESVDVTLDVFNLPGLAQSLTYVEADHAGFGSTLYRQAPRAVRLGVEARY